MENKHRLGIALPLPIAARPQHSHFRLRSLKVFVLSFTNHPLHEVSIQSKTLSSVDHPAQTETDACHPVFSELFGQSQAPETAPVARLQPSDSPFASAATASCGSNQASQTALVSRYSL